MSRCRVLLTVVVLAAGAPHARVSAQAPAPARSGTTTAAPALRDVRGAFLALSVADLEASKRWYVEKLGLRVVQEPPPVNGAAAVILEGGGLMVELVRLNAATPRAGDAARSHGFFKGGVVIDDLDGAVSKLRARGVEIAFGPYPARPGQRANVIIRDNAGNLLQLFGR